MELEYREPDGLAHAPHLAVATFVDRHAEDRAVRIACDHADPSGSAQPPGLEAHAALQPAQLTLGGLAVDPHPVVLLDPVAWVHQMMRKIAVIGEYQEAAGVGIEAPDREHARTGGQELPNRAPTLRVAQSRNHTDRLVEREVAERGRTGQQATLDLDAILVGLDQCSRLSHDRSVDADHARSNQGIARPS